MKNQPSLFTFFRKIFDATHKKTQPLHKDQPKKAHGISLLLRLIGETDVSLWMVLLSLALCGISAALALAAPVLIGRATDFALGKGRVDLVYIKQLVLLLVAAVSGSAFFSWLGGVLNNALATKTVCRLRIKAFNNLQNVSLNYIDSTSHGDIINRLSTDTQQVSIALSIGLTQLFSGAVTIILTLFLIFNIESNMAVSVIVITPLSLVAAMFISGKSFSLLQSSTKKRGELAGFVSEMISCHGLIKNTGYIHTALERFSVQNDELCSVAHRATFISSLTNPATRFVNTLVYAAVAFSGALSVIAGTVSVGGLVAALSFANQYTKPFNEISAVFAQLQAANASLERIFELIDAPAEQVFLPQIKIKAEELPKEFSRKTDISFENVSFGYNKEKPVLHNITFNVKTNEKVAVVGETGSGKTTLLNLLMRFYDVDSGAIHIGANDIRTFNLHVHRQRFGMVLQDSWLFSGTVRDNIAYGRPDATMDEVKNAAKLANAEQFILRLPDGYDTLIKNTAQFSEGQRQLICIARVILARPEFIILDEATSAIDTLTEAKVQQAIDRIAEGRTVVYIAHRLSTVQNATKIIVLSDGKIVECGTHRELLALGGVYAAMFE